MSNPNACIIKTDGTNCDEEMQRAFEVGGARADIVHINELRDGSKRLRDYGILGLAGGFANGDDIRSGQVLANELVTQLYDEVQEFAAAGKPAIGVCNGFQVMVRSGLLPKRELGKQDVTLAHNTVGRFECRWIDLAVGKSVCKYVQPGDFDEPTIPVQTAHGEGRFFGDAEHIQELTNNGQIVFRYALPDLSEPVEYPHNPNGAVDNIAGICDPSGVILGLMPHFERSITAFHPHRARTSAAYNAALTIFQNIASYSRNA